MRGIRNPKAHSNVQIDAPRAMHLIFLASLLMSDRVYLEHCALVRDELRLVSLA
jgi:hypothetical protein